MKLIVGLGNPGKEYENTRHNVGFSFVDKYISYKNIKDNWIKKFDGFYLKTSIDGETVIFLKPQTYMNLSGISVRKVVDYFKIDISDILVVCDDLDLNVGNFKLRPSGSCGGHNGLRDIENKLSSSKLSSSNYKRLKIGISKNNNIDTKDYVLGKFSKEEKSIYEYMFKELFNVLDDYFKLPFGDLMSKYNRKNR